MRKQLLLGAFMLGSFFTAQAQDTCETAVAIEPGLHTVGTLNGTYVTGCWTTPSASPNAEWYSFTSDEDVMVRINSDIPVNDPATVDTRVSVFTGECGTLTCYSLSDDINPAATGGNYLTNFTFPAEAGVTYYIQFDDRWADAGFVFQLTTQSPDCASSVPFIETWDQEANYYFCWDEFNIGGDTDPVAWQYNDVNDFNGDGFDDSVLAIPSVATGNTAKDDWVISGGLDLTAGTQYTITVKFLAFDNGAGQVANENLEVLMLNEQDPDAVGQISVAEFNNIVQPTIPAGTTDIEALATTETFTFTPPSTGTHHLAFHATSAAPSGWLVIFHTLVQETLGTNDALSSQFSVFPNPSTNVINIANAENILVNGVEIVDINGRTVKSVKLNNVSEAQINISDLASGMYLMNISSDKGTTTKKIVKN